MRSSWRMGWSRGWARGCRGRRWSITHDCGAILHLDGHSVRTEFSNPLINFVDDEKVALRCKHDAPVRSAEVSSTVWTTSDQHTGCVRARREFYNPVIGLVGYQQVPRRIYRDSGRKEPSIHGR